MGFRFHKSINLFPGVRVNLSKSGVSTSIGRPGATINISERGTRTTVGIPGTGLSYSETHSIHHAESKSDPVQPVSYQPPGKSLAPMVLLVLAALFAGVLIFRLVAS